MRASAHSNKGEAPAGHPVAYDVGGLPVEHTAFIRETPEGRWRLLVAEPGGTFAPRGEFPTPETALTHLQAEYRRAQLTMSPARVFT